MDFAKKILKSPTTLKKLKKKKSIKGSDFLIY